MGAWCPLTFLRLGHNPREFLAQKEFARLSSWLLGILTMVSIKRPLLCNFQGMVCLPFPTEVGGHGELFTFVSFKTVAYLAHLHAKRRRVSKCVSLCESGKFFHSFCYVSNKSIIRIKCPWKLFTHVYDINWVPQDAWSSGLQLLSCNKLVSSCQSRPIAPPS